MSIKMHQALADGLNIDIDADAVVVDEEPEPTAVAVVPPSANTVPAVAQPPVNVAADTDFDTARGNLAHLADVGRRAVDSAAAIAEGTEHPRAFEVLGQLISHLTITNKELVQIHQAKQKIDKAGAEKANSAPNVTNSQTNVFFGSTKELQELLSKRKRPALEV